LVGLTECCKVPPRQFIHLDTKTLASDPPLKLGRKKSILQRNQDAHWRGRPALEGATRCEHAVRLIRLTACPRRIDHGLGYIVKELDQWIERRIYCTALADGLLAPGIPLMRIVEPLARALTGLWNHRIEENQHSDGQARAHERGREATK
jgi:hypothetical protein